MKDDIKLPPLHYEELPQLDDPIPVIQAYARKAIKADRQLRSEPVGYICEEHLNIALRGWTYMCQIQPEPQKGFTAIYTTPPQIETSPPKD